MKDVATSVPVEEGNGLEMKNETPPLLKTPKQAVVVAEQTNGQPRPTVIANGHAAAKETRPVSDIDAYENSLLHDVSDSSDSEHILELELSDDELISSELSSGATTATNELPSSISDAASTDRDNASTDKENVPADRDNVPANKDDVSADKYVLSEASSTIQVSSSPLESAPVSSLPVTLSSDEGGLVAHTPAKVENSTHVEESSTFKKENSTHIEESSTCKKENSTPVVAPAVENGERSESSSPDCVIINESRSEPIVDSKPSALASSKAATDEASRDIQSLPEQDKVEEESFKIEEEPTVVKDGDQTKKSEITQEIDIVDLDGAEKEPDVDTKENVSANLAADEPAKSDTKNSSVCAEGKEPPRPLESEIPIIDIDDSSTDSDFGKRSTAEVAVEVAPAKPEAVRDNASAMSCVSTSEDEDRLQLNSSGSLFEAAEVTAEEGNESKNARELKTDESNVVVESGSATEKPDSASAEISEVTAPKTECQLSEIPALAVDKTDVAVTDTSESTVDKAVSASSDVSEMAIDNSDDESADIVEVKADKANSDSAKIDSASVDKSNSESADVAEVAVDKPDSKLAEVAEISVDKLDSDSAEVAEISVGKPDSDSAKVAEISVDESDIDSAEVDGASIHKPDSESAEVAAEADLKANGALSEIAEPTVDKLDISEAADKTEIGYTVVDKLQLVSAVVEQAESTSSDKVECTEETQEKANFSSALEIVQETLEIIVTAAMNGVEVTAEKPVNAVYVNDEQAEIVPPSRKLDQDEVISIGDDSNEGPSVSAVDKVKDDAALGDKVVDVKPVQSPVAGVSDSTLQNSTSLDNDGDVHAIKIDKKYLQVNASSSENDDSKTLLDVTPKPNNENVTTTEDRPKQRAKRSCTANPDDETLSKRLKNNGDEAPNGVRNISKENLNPASQKRGTTSSGTVDEVKKARIDTLRERKPSKKRQEMSNLEKAIARVASGGLSIREQEIGMMIMQLTSKSLEHLTVTQLEDIVQFKIGQFVSEMSECASYRKEIAQLKLEVEKYQATAKGMSKQVRDLENVMKKMLSDIKNLPTDALPLPAKVNRSVGLQVGDGRISNEQKKLAMPPRYEQQGVPQRRSGILTNRPPPVATTPAQPPPIPPTRIRPPAPFSTPTAPLTTPPKRVAPPNPPVLSPQAGRLPTSLVPFNTPPKTSSVVVATTTHVVAGPGLVTRQMRPAQPASRQTGLIDLTDEPPMPPLATRQFLTTAGVRQAVPTKQQVRVVTPINPVGMAGRRVDGSIRLVTQSSLSAPPSARVAYMVPASATGGEPRMYFSATAPKVPTTNGGSVLTVSRPNNLPPKTFIYSSNVVQAAQGQRSTGFKQLLPVSRQANAQIPGRLRVERRMVHPAPLPLTPTILTAHPHWKKPPPHPDLKISKCDKRSRGENGIILSWKMDSLSSDHEDIASYQLYAYQETSGEPNTSMWKKVGDVKSMALPMACTLTQFTEGNKYHFAVRAVDAKGRTGPFSRPGNILLSVLDD